MYAQFADEDEVLAMRNRYLAGISWADAKRALFEAMDTFMAGPRAVYSDLMAHPDKMDEILADGARKARALAAPVLERVRKAVGKTP